jgi:hypothetical protein
MYGAVVASCMAWQHLAPLQLRIGRGAYRHEIPEISHFNLTIGFGVADTIPAC